MPRAKQSYLPGFESLGSRAFGGALLGRGHPRDARPVSLKRPLHLVMRSTRATGPLSLLSPRRAKRVEAIVRATARGKGVRIYRYANSGNHLHILLRAPSHRAYRAYVRAVTGLIARLVTGTERGLAHSHRLKGKAESSYQTSNPPKSVGAHKGSAAIQAASERAHSKHTPFWDARPFTRIVEWGRDFGQACAYLLQNRLEALGFIPYRPRERRRLRP